jgi:hypothetical protein
MSDIFLTNVRKILCHAEFACRRCSKPYLCMGLAPVNNLGQVSGNAERLGHEICNACEAADQEHERREYNRSRQQRAWVKRAKEKLHRK